MHELVRRAAAIDAEPLVGRPDNVDADVYRVLAVLSRVTPVGRSRLAELPVALPATADEMIGTSSTLQRLADRAPDIVGGPLSQHAQHWVATGRPAHVPPRQQVLAREHFVDVKAFTDPPSTTPFGVGLFTSTATLSPYGMWHAYLECNRGSSLFPPPWHVWKVEPLDGSRIFEAPTASRWAELVTTYPIHDGSAVYPDWRAIGADWDAVHLGLAAIAASQGVCLVADGDHRIAPPWWDVESTFWLHWRFTEAEQVHSE